MTVIVCVDEQGGILFNRRRVSSDRAVISDLLKQIGTQTLCMRAYSAKLFPARTNIRISENCLADVNREEVLFLEDAAPERLLDKADRVILYCWNRLYPSDVRFPMDWLLSCGRLESAVDFEGNSHSQITREVYVL